MIKTLQRKFVVTSMVAITALILMLLGAINIANIVLTNKKSNETLEMLSEAKEAPELPAPITGDVSHNAPPPSLPDVFTKKHNQNYDAFQLSHYFIVRFDHNGKAIFVDVSRTSNVTEEDAITLANQVRNQNAKAGKNGRYRYQISDEQPMGDQLVVFLDVFDEIISYLQVLVLSVAIGILCWGLMLLLVIILSKRAIRPIAENVEKQKQFVTNAGHEIKTPLAIIQTNTEAMELFQGESKWSKNIKVQTTRLSGLMQNLLALSRMDEGITPIHITEFNLSELVTETIQGFLEPLELKNINPQIQIQPDLRIHADQIQIEQLISILLDNAVKYINDGGELSIHLQKKEKHCKLVVQNTCEELPNVPPKKLFDRFYRSNQARTQKSGGYGIGLSMAQSIATANNGTIHADYISLNQIRFTVIL